MEQHHGKRSGDLTILILYRGGWCPFCNTQMGQLQKIEPTLARMGCRIPAVSADRPSEMKKSLDKRRLTYSLLCDIGMAASRAFGVDHGTLKKDKSSRIDLEAAFGEKHHMLPMPSVFVRLTDRVIQFSYANPNYVRCGWRPNFSLRPQKQLCRHRRVSLRLHSCLINRAALLSRDYGAVSDTDSSCLPMKPACRLPVAISTPITRG